MDTAAGSDIEQQLDHLDAALDKAFNLPLFPTETDILAAVLRVPSLRAKFDALATRLVTHADDWRLSRTVGLRNTAQLLAAQTNTDPEPIRALSRRGQWIRNFSLFADAASRGILSPEHLDLIRRTADRPHTHFLLHQDQQLLIDAAATCGFVDFKLVVSTWINAADPDGNEPKDQTARTALTIKKLGNGSVKATMELDPLLGDTLMRHVEHQAKTLAATDEADGIERTPRNRAATALVDLVVKGTQRADGSFPLPLVDVVLGEKLAEDLVERALRDDPVINAQPFPVDPNDTNYRCTLLDGTPLHPSFAMAVIGVAEFQRTIIDAKSRIIDASYKTKTFPAWMKHRLLLAAKGQCEQPGCDAPFAWLQADHIHPTSHGGQTTLNQGQILCAPDNQSKSNQTGHQPWRNKPTTPR